MFTNNQVSQNLVKDVAKLLERNYVKVEGNKATVMTREGKAVRSFSRADYGTEFKKKAYDYLSTNEEITEAKMAKKDHDGDGKIESGKDEYMGSRHKAIQKAMKKEAKDLNADNVSAVVKHDCASHVVHKEHGEGTCIPGQHTLVEKEKKECTHCEGTGKHGDEDCEKCDGKGYIMEGYVTHYDVMFKGEDGPFIISDVAVEDLEIVSESHHGHPKKKK